MVKIKSILGLAGLASIAFSCKPSAENNAVVNKQGKPNIIFILADDLGYGDLGCYGQEKIYTPNIDKMASEGIRFTQHYAGCTVCAPSRCVLMTGKHMGHAYIRGNTKENIPLSEVTLAEVMKGAGYVTGMYGKWGLGLNGTSGDPANQGYDEFTGYNNQTEAHFYYVDTIDKIVNGKTVRFPVDNKKYSHEIFAEEAINFIKNYKDTSFFLYLPFCLPHAELLAPDKDMAQYLDAEGNSIFEETPYIGKHYASQDKPRATYAAMVSKLDRNVGEIIELVKNLGIDDNTYIFFTSDNGPHTAGGHDYKFFNGNGPLRGYKRDLYEGGIRVPMIAWAPGRVPASKTSDVVWGFYDVMPTFADMIDAPVPENIDGLSFAKAIHGDYPDTLHSGMYWEFCVGWSKEPKGLMQAYRSGEWKLLKIQYPGKETQYELYNLYDDFAEENNLYAQEKEIAARLLKELEENCEKPQNDAFYDFTTFK